MGEGTVVLTRSVLTFVNLLIFSRILGKTQVAHLTFFEYVAGATLGSIAAELSASLSIRPWPIFVALATWVVLTLAMQFTAIKSRWLSKMLDGEPVVLIQDGQILERNLRRMRMRESELLELLRGQSIFHVDEVELAIMEPRGSLSVLKRPEHLPATVSDLHIQTRSRGLGIELVVDGEVMDQNLRRLGVNRAWLTAKLQEQGLSGPEEAFLAVVDAEGKVYVDRYTDKFPPALDLSDYPGPN
ncbi:uncharacterized membrane protein YcaP (DUF421 family) [Symbiobacterium terraclitae]|uniref:Uncharacterized membrane protein YcaP (DUF421 family) n=1 Tax=Symbiobacterium terraclitae TaxID=557451 RepID=A0ABS4JV51_9FIRM|nr:DUF421 domain-containing protein [Symbiobacterium terraclitae]MBP2019389.1 uncharacterized membrane protein YcaP (DUF421 family) [Symbiobacterium terraclitae]